MCFIQSVEGAAALIPDKSAILLDDWFRRERFIFVGWSGSLLLPTAYLAVGGWFTGITYVSSWFTHVIGTSFIEG